MRLTSHFLEEGAGVLRECVATHIDGDRNSFLGASFLGRCGADSVGACNNEATGDYRHIWRNHL